MICECVCMLSSRDVHRNSDLVPYVHMRRGLSIVVTNLWYICSEQPTYTSVKSIINVNLGRNGECFYAHFAHENIDCLEMIVVSRHSYSSFVCI